MTDYTTSAKLLLKDDFYDLTSPEDNNNDWIDSKNNDFFVITETDYDFENLLHIFNLTKKELPYVSQRYYRKDFLLKNINIMQNSFLQYLNFIEDEKEYEEYYESIVDFENYIKEEDLKTGELSDFYNAALCHFEDDNGKSVYAHYTSIQLFEGYPEKAFYTKKERAFVFKVGHSGGIPARCFTNFNLKDEGSYYSLVFPSKDVKKHVVDEKTYLFWKEYIDDIEEEGFKDDDGIPVLFAFG